MIYPSNSTTFHSNLLRRFLIVLFASTLITPICIGQIGMGGTDEEGFMRLTNDTIKREIALFSVKGGSLIATNGLSKIKLEKISLKKCTDSSVYFSKSGGVKNTTLIVSIYSDQGLEGSTVKEVKYIHVKYQLILPDNAIEGIYDPKFCLKHSKHEVSNCKVFRSQDKRRVYIYMQNGVGSNRYEVTWIVQDSQYFARVIDHL